MLKHSRTLHWRLSTTLRHPRNPNREVSVNLILVVTHMKSSHPTHVRSLPQTLLTPECLLAPLGPARLLTLERLLLHSTAQGCVAPCQSGLGEHPLMLSPDLIPTILLSSPGNNAPLASCDDVFPGVYLPLQSSTACEYQQLLCPSSCPGLSSRRALGPWQV